MADSANPQLTWANIISTIVVILTMFGGAWMLAQSQFASLEKQFTAADASLRQQVQELSADLTRQVNNSVLRAEHTEFVKRLDDKFDGVREQLKIIETTRPTTGELQTIGTGLKEEVREIKDRVRSLEDNLRRPQPLAPLTPPGR